MTRTGATRNKAPQPVGQWRFVVVVAGVVMVFVALIARFFWLQVVQADDLIRKGDQRTVRTKSRDVERGMILDRNGQELAVSIPVNAIWADPKIINDYVQSSGVRLAKDDRWNALVDVLHLNRQKLTDNIVSNPTRRFMYLKRQVEPAMAEYVRQLKIPGIYLRKESRRYYPDGEITAHIVGFTNIDGQGIEGVEKSFNEQLTGSAGKRTIRKDARGREIEVIDQEDKVKPADVVLTIDQRIQSVTYKALKTAVASFGATSGSAVVVNVKNGEILALANSPSFNPNNRQGVEAHRFRNRAITDVFEPGSTVKPLAVLSALEFGSYQKDAVIDTSPGWMIVGGSRVTDSRNYGPLSLRGVIQKSSNVGVTHLALSMPKPFFLDMFYSMGFGNTTGLELIGESYGLFGDRHRWSDFELATLSFGYGLGVTTVQLAKMYSILGNDGVSQPLKIVKQEVAEPGERIFTEGVTGNVLEMMESVVEKGGTGKRANVMGYRVAGKTGTSIKAVAGGYGDDYVGIFAGVAPVTNPELAVVIMINDPDGDYYHGGEVAAPVFSEVMAGALQILNVPPDNFEETQTVLSARRQNNV